MIVVMYMPLDDSLTPAQWTNLDQKDSLRLYTQHPKPLL